MTAADVTAGSTLDRVGARESAGGFNHKSRSRALRDQLARVVMWAAFATAMVPLVWILWSVITKGGAMLLNSQCTVVNDPDIEERQFWQGLGM